MITLDKAIGIVEKKFPDREITSSAYYKGDYIFCAPGKDMGELNDTSDPYYIVKKDTGDICKFIPTEDLNGFIDAFTNHEIK